MLRIVGHTRYPNSPGTPAAVAELMMEFAALPGHTFWPDNITLLGGEHIQVDRLLDSAQVTDSYLLALAVANGGKLATFDRGIVTDAVVGGSEALLVIE